MSYQLLPLQEHETDEHELLDHTHRLRTKHKRLLVVVLVGIVALLELGLIIQLSLFRFSQSEGEKWDRIYSPANEMVEYKIRTHYGDAGDNISPFWGPPSPELDLKWESLSSDFILKIPKAQAALLPNKTSPIPNDGENVAVELDVFHEIRCLNILRKALFPDYYTSKDNTEGRDDWQVKQCIDSVRQSLMCSADISVIVWQWSEASQKNLPKGNIAHTCRNFDKIQEWAKDRQFHSTPYFN